MGSKKSPLVPIISTHLTKCLLVIFTLCDYSQFNRYLYRYLVKSYGVPWTLNSSRNARRVSKRECTSSSLVEILARYMDGVLAIEPDVRTRVLQKFLEVDVRRAV